MKVLRSAAERASNEPALVRTGIVGVAAILALFGIGNADLDAARVEAIQGGVVLLFSLLGGSWVRRAVTPTGRAEKTAREASETAYVAGLYEPVPETLAADADEQGETPGEVPA